MYNKTKTCTRVVRLDRDFINKILKRFGSGINFFRETDIKNSVSKDVLYAALRGEPVTIEASTAIRTTFTKITYKYFSREIAVKILEEGGRLAEENGAIPLSAKTVFENLVEFNHENPF